MPHSNKSSVVTKNVLNSGSHANRLNVELDGLREKKCESSLIYLLTKQYFEMNCVMLK